MTLSKSAAWYNDAADWIANKYWESGDDASRTQAAVRGYANQGQQAPWYSPMRYMSDKGRQDLTQKATQHMTGGGLADMLGIKDQSLMGNLKSNWQDHLPMLGGLGMGLYGLASRNPWMMLAGLASGGYGLYNAYQAGQTLKDPKMLQLAAGQSGSKREQLAAKNRLRREYGKVMPYMGIADKLGLKLGPGVAKNPKTASYAQKFMSNFQVSQLVDELKRDPNVDTRTAAELIVAAEHAQRMDSKPTSLINVGEFAQSAANGFGFEVGRTIGSLMTLAPTVKNVIRRVGGGGLFSGAKALGVL